MNLTTSLEAPWPAVEEILVVHSVVVANLTSGVLLFVFSITIIIAAASLCTWACVVVVVVYKHIDFWLWLTLHYSLPSCAPCAAYSSSGLLTLWSTAWQKVMWRWMPPLCVNCTLFTVCSARLRCDRDRMENTLNSPQPTVKSDSDISEWCQHWSTGLHFLYNQFCFFVCPPMPLHIFRCPLLL